MPKYAKMGRDKENLRQPRTKDGLMNLPSQSNIQEVPRVPPQLCIFSPANFPHTIYRVKDLRDDSKHLLRLSSLMDTLYVHSNIPE